MIGAGHVGVTPAKSGVRRVTQFQMNCVVPCVSVTFSEDDGLAFASSVTRLHRRDLSKSNSPCVRRVHLERGRGSRDKVACPRWMPRRASRI